MPKIDIFISADDIGISSSITDGILRCADAGLVDHVSLVANGADFDRAVRLLKDRPALGVAVHGNLIEGRALCPSSAIPALVGPDGLFQTGFIGLWARYLRSGPSERHAMADQVRMEIDAQIRKVREAFGEHRAIGLDSHQHTHMIPFIFPLFLEMAEKHGLCRVRVPREPFFAYFGSGAFRVYAGSGLLKHLLLNYLSFRQRMRIRENALTMARGFVGVLFTGCMTANIVSKALTRLAKRGGGSTGEVEILFHPGGASHEERDLWAGRPEFLDFYFSANRKAEAEELARIDLPEGVTRHYAHLTGPTGE